MKHRSNAEMKIRVPSVAGIPPPSFVYFVVPPIFCPVVLLSRSGHITDFTDAESATRDWACDASSLASRNGTRFVAYYVGIKRAEEDAGQA